MSMYNTAMTPLMYHLNNVYPSWLTPVYPALTSVWLRRICLSIVEGKGFGDLINIIKPAYQIPSWCTINRLLETHYNEVVKKVGHSWESCSNQTAGTAESYLTITCHYIGEDWKKTQWQPTQKKQEQMGLATHWLIQSCKTQWNSCCEMFNWLVGQNCPVGPHRY